MDIICQHRYLRARENQARRPKPSATKARAASVTRSQGQPVPENSPACSTWDSGSWAWRAAMSAPAPVAFWASDCKAASSSPSPGCAAVSPMSPESPSTPAVGSSAAGAANIRGASSAKGSSGGGWGFSSASATACSSAAVSSGAGSWAANFMPRSSTPTSRP